MAYVDYQLEQDRLKRNRDIADALLKQSQQSIGDTQFAPGGFAIRRSPMEGVAKLAQAWSGKSLLDQNDTDTKNLAQTKDADLASAIEEYQRATHSRPAGMGGDSSIPGDEMFNPAYTPTPEDKRLAGLQLAGRVGSREKVAEALAADALKTPEMKAFKPGDVLYQDGKPVTKIPDKRNYHVVDGNLVQEPEAPGAAVQPAFTAPVKPPPPTELARLQGERATIAANDPRDPRLSQYDAAISKFTTHQPAPTINVNTEKQLLGHIAQNLGEGVAKTTEQAKAAVGTLQTVSRLREALDSGAVVAGPGATPQMILMQIGQRLDPTSEPSAALTKTREVVQTLAQLELDAAQQMKGQGQITEAEREIIRRASAGDIDRMTVPELKTLASTLDKTARFKIKANAANVERLRKNPNAAPMVDMMTVDEPPMYAPPKKAGPGSSGGGSRLRRNSDGSFDYVPG